MSQMKDTMEKDLAEATAAEEKAIGMYDEFISATEKKIDANTDDSLRARLSAMAIWDLSSKQ